MPNVVPASLDVEASQVHPEQRPRRLKSQTELIFSSLEYCQAPTHLSTQLSSVQLHLKDDKEIVPIFGKHPPTTIILF